MDNTTARQFDAYLECINTLHRKILDVESLLYNIKKDNKNLWNKCDLLHNENIKLKNNIDQLEKGIRMGLQQ